MKKNKKPERPKFLSFANRINEKNVKTGLRYIRAYEEKLTSLNFNKNIIYSIKELPYSKRNIKIAYKRLIFTHDFNDKIIFNSIKIYFPIVANFQNHKTNSFSKSSQKIQSLYKDELADITEALKRFEKDVLPVLRKRIK